jgi:hypothetical protein
MEQIGYSLIDSESNELQFWGDTAGLCAELPNPVILPNGDRVHGASAGQLQDWRLVPRMLDSSKDAEPAFDGASFIISRHPPVPRTITKLRLKLILQPMGLWDQLKAMLATNADAQETWELATDVNRAHPLVETFRLQAGKTQEDIDDIFRAQ